MKYANKPGEIKKRKWIGGYSLQNFFTKKDWMSFTTHLVIKSTEYLYLSLNTFPLLPDFNSELTPQVIKVNFTFAENLREISQMAPMSLLIGRHPHEHARNISVNT